MGASVQAKIFYGYLWTDETDELALGDFAEGNALEGKDPSEWPALIASRRGVVNPWDSFVESTAKTHAQREAENEAWITANEAGLVAWRRCRKEIEAEFGVDFDSHGHYEYRSRHLAAVGSQREVGSTDGFDLGTLPEVAPPWCEKLNRWLAEFNIEPPQDAPRWWVVAFYG